MIIVTGAAGFIGSNIIAHLNNKGFVDIVAVDDFSHPEKNKNLEKKKIRQQLHRDMFIPWIKDNHRFIQFIIHIGARTDTAEWNTAIFDKLNLNYSKDLWKQCVEYGLPLIYASSAATYGNGEYGYSDNHAGIDRLKPLNPYGWSKQHFDKWAIEQKEQPYFWAGLKFFNVYGPNEYHKGRMASVIFHAYKQIQQSGKVLLFRSHRSDIADGQQSRDFIYVKDICDIVYFFMHHRKDSGIYNAGTGTARSFNDLAIAIFNAMHKTPNISYIDIPEDIRDKYQYYTCAEMQKLQSIGYKKTFHTLEEGCIDYVNNYLKKQ